MKYKLKEGWTKARVMEQVKKYNNGTRSTNGRSSCMYRASNGNRCAIGCFIPDGHEALDHVGIVVYPICELHEYGNRDSLLGTKHYPELLEFMPFDDFRALQDFQLAHDRCDLDPNFDGNVYKAIEHFLETQVE